MDQELKQALEQMEKRLISYIDQKFNQVKKDIIDEVRTIMSIGNVAQETKIEQELKLIGYYSRLEQVRAHEFRITQLENLAGISQK